MQVSHLEVPVIAKEFNNATFIFVDDAEIEYYIHKGVMKILGHPVQVEP